MQCIVERFQSSDASHGAPARTRKAKVLRPRKQYSKSSLGTKSRFKLNMEMIVRCRLLCLHLQDVSVSRDSCPCLLNAWDSQTWGSTPLVRSSTLHSAFILGYHGRTTHAWKNVSRSIGDCYHNANETSHPFFVKDNPIASKERSNHSLLVSRLKCSDWSSNLREHCTQDFIALQEMISSTYPFLLVVEHTMLEDFLSADFYQGLKVSLAQRRSFLVLCLFPCAEEICWICGNVVSGGTNHGLRGRTKRSSAFSDSKCFCRCIKVEFHHQAN